MTCDAPVVDRGFYKTYRVFFAMQMELRERGEIANGFQACLINRVRIVPACRNASNLYGLFENHRAFTWKRQSH